ncbi:MAG: methyltransferase domain-containing protein [Bradyrhizobium sp.]|uniref:methyltransferase domain-containing protein n=1 Tax=Bradyrhizobium sp. TaxID=376 RepID=UPI00239F10B2|nr:class I SAM-dependent methyltransferase [Bradyrhizobium sp.]MDE2603914.1 methyltransferase domain-containing protein [Bradyrhizobium sp.]
MRLKAIKHFISELLYERRYGVRTSGKLILDKHDAENVCYAPMNWRQFRSTLRHDTVTDRDVFLDIGSGKGRAVLMAAIGYPFARVIGVELIKEFHDIAERNLLAVSRRCRAAKVELICADLRDYQIPDDVTVVYMNNPVRGAIFKHVLSSMTDSMKRRPRRMRWIYFNPLEEEAILVTGEWRKVCTIAPGWRKPKSPYGTTCVYESRQTGLSSMPVSQADWKA